MWVPLLWTGLLRRGIVVAPLVGARFFTQKFDGHPLIGAFAKSWEIVGADLSRLLPIYRLWVPCRDLANAPPMGVWGISPIPYFTISSKGWGAHSCCVQSGIKNTPFFSTYATMFTMWNHSYRRTMIAKE